MLCDWCRNILEASIAWLEEGDVVCGRDDAQSKEEVFGGSSDGEIAIGRA